jgi:hypothetical protein
MYDEGLPEGSPAELTAIQEQIDEWIDRGLVIERDVSRGKNQLPKVLFRVAHPWELDTPPPADKRHIHDWRYDMTQQGDNEGLVYCSACGREVTVAHADYADPRVIRHVGDTLPNREDFRATES